MSEPSKPNSGALFKNDKQGNEKRPDYRGQLNVGGVEYWLSAWLNTIKSGDNKGGKYMALKVQPKEGAATASASDASPPAASKDFDDDIPFVHAWIALPLVSALLGGALHAAQYV